MMLASKRCRYTGLEHIERFLTLDITSGLASYYKPALTETGPIIRIKYGTLENPIQEHQH